MALSTAIMPLEGVLRKPKTPGWTPIAEGFKLYESLCYNYSVCLLVDAEEREQVDRWLVVNGLQGHSIVEELATVEVTIYGEGDAKVRKIRDMKFSGFNVDLVVEPDPAVAATLINGGFCVITFTHPVYSLPEWRPDAPKRGPRNWDDLQQQIAEQAFLKATDMRMDE